MELNKYIDHTLLKAEATQEQIETLCSEAIKYKFATVCINPNWVAVAAKQLQDSEVGVCTVIGFPLGANTTATKVFEVNDAIANGATEIDMVVNVGAIKSDDFDFVYNDILAVVNAAGDKLVKVIIETSLLTEAEKIKVCNLVVQAKAAFVKTSTGFSFSGATAEDVKLMKETVGDKAEVKASGGVRSLEAAMEMIEAGASRIGTSSGVLLVNN